MVGTAVRFGEPSEPPLVPPAGTVERIQIASPLGRNWAYVTPVREGARKPAVVYLVGGFSWSLSESAWRPQPRSNDQSGQAFEEAGFVVIHPSVRGAHDNPGARECFFGEVDDVVAAVDYALTRPDVDPERVFIFGHSTGALLALLAAESTNRIRGVVAVGPVRDPVSYQHCVPTGLSLQERALRKTTTYIERLTAQALIIEGEIGGNAAEVEAHAGLSPLVAAVVVPGFDHFTVLRPTTEVVARAIQAEEDLRNITAARVTKQAADALIARCGQSPFDGLSNSSPTPGFVGDHHLLTNEVRFVDRSPLRGASAFLLQLPDGGVALATAAHLTGEAGGIEPPMDFGDLADSSDGFERSLKAWAAFPRADDDDSFVISRRRLGPALFGDWLLLEVDKQEGLIEALPLSRRPVEVGEAVELLACEYRDRSCRQKRFAGQVTERTEESVRFTLNPAAAIAGFSGAPLLNTAGAVVGVFSVSSQLKRTDAGLALEGQADDALIQHVARCARLDGGVGD